jgi:uncharacterized protein (DUF58 family)
VLVTAALLVASGLWLRYPLLTVLGATGLAVVAASLLVARRDPRIEVTRKIHPVRVERGRPAAALLSVRRSAGAAEPSASRPFGPPVTIRDSVAGRVIEVRTADTVEYPLPTSTRGRFPVGPLEIGRDDPLGLARGRHRADVFAMLTVHPRQLPARPDGGRSRTAAPGPATDDLWQGADEQRGVREYRPGDEVRHLHWKAIAHTGRLMIRELADLRQARLSVLLDTRTGSLRPPDFEEAVDLAASLLGAAGRAGLRTRLFTAGGREITGHFLEALTDVRQDEATILEAGGGGRLVLITGETAAPPRLGRTFSSVVVLTLGGGVGAEQALRRWNETRR